MKRRLFFLLGMLSLLLCLASAILWVRSSKSLDSLEYTTAGGTYYAFQSFGPGEIRLLIAHNAPGPTGLSIFPRVPHGRVHTFFPSGVISGVGTISQWFTANGKVISAGSFPYSAIAVLDIEIVLAAMVSCCLWFLLAKRQARRDMAGHCPACGYDMRATPARCPECGAAPPTTPV